MKQLLLLTALCAALTVRAQEKVPAEEVQKIARRVLEASGETGNAQVKIAPDADKADALRAGDVGILVMPDKKLAAEALEKAGADYVAVGHLYFKGLAPVKDGSVTANDKLRFLSFDDKGNTIRIPLCLLGARKHDGQLELAVFGNDKTPLLHVPLRKSDRSGSVPIEISGEKRGEDAGELTLNVLGKYEAKLIVKKQAD